LAIYTYKERASKQKAGAILSGSQNTIFYPSIFLATYFEPWKEKKWKIFLNFGGIMATENLQKTLDFTNFSF
jgi:hypothetical protein